MGERQNAPAPQATRFTNDSLTLVQVYSRLRNHFGYHPQWWPGSPSEITITALLVQQCDWSVAWAAVQRLRERGLLELPTLASADSGKVCSLIQPVAFAPTKARRVISMATSIHNMGFDTIESYLSSRTKAQLRRELLSMNGIGEETADCILLYASRHPCFVVDAYARRILARIDCLRDIKPEAITAMKYGKLQAIIERTLLAGLDLFRRHGFDGRARIELALFRDFHAQLVELGKHHCLKQNPRCSSRGKSGWKDYRICLSHCTGTSRCNSCPLLDICRRGLEGGGTLKAVR